MLVSVCPPHLLNATVLWYLGKVSKPENQATGGVFQFYQVTTLNTRLRQCFPYL